MLDISILFVLRHLIYSMLHIYVTYICNILYIKYVTYYISNAAITYYIVCYIYSM